MYGLIASGALRERNAAGEERINVCEATRLFGQAFTAVDALRSACIAHGDVKPDNLLLSAISEASSCDKPQLHVKIGDFGHARQLMLKPQQPDEHLTVLVPAGGTPGFAAPEQNCLGGPTAVGQLSSEADMHALAYTGFEVLHGRLLSSNQFSQCATPRTLSVPAHLIAALRMYIRKARRAHSQPSRTKSSPEPYKFFPLTL